MSRPVAEARTKNEKHFEKYPSWSVDLPTHGAIRTLACFAMPGTETDNVRTRGLKPARALPMSVAHLRRCNVRP
eukprot:1349414-Rhodomonas_salina.2